MKIEFDVLGAGVVAPGMGDWDELLAVLSGAELAEQTAIPKSTLLSARERRRAPATVKLSFAAAEQACRMASISPGDPEAVFSSAMGDVDITDYMCSTLAEEPELLSPTRFHNSVHNAASGYWSIGTGATGDVTAVSGWHDSAVAGLGEALTRLNTRRQPVLLVVYDDSATGPLAGIWTPQHYFASALVLAPAGTGDPALIRLAAEPQRGQEAQPSLPGPLIERMADNPAARMLPLLALVAGHDAAPVVLNAEQGPGLRFEKLES